MANSDTKSESPFFPATMNNSSNVFPVDPGGNFSNGTSSQFSFLYPPPQPLPPKSLIIDGLLDKVMRITNDAREAYSRGHEAEGSKRIGDLKTLVEVVSNFSAAKHPPTAVATAAAAALDHPDQKRVSPPSATATAAAAAVAAATASRKASFSGSTSSLLQPPQEDASRKRCASAQGDRVLKSLKLEPKEEAIPAVLPPPGPPSAGLTPTTSLTPTPASISAPPAPAALLAPPPGPPPLLQTQSFPGAIHSLTLTQQPQSHMPVHPHLDHSTVSLQHPHPHLPHMPPLTLAPNGTTAPVSVPSVPPPPPTGWHDPALMPAPQVVPPPQPPRFHPRAGRSSSYSGAFPFAFSVAAPPPAPAPPATEEPSLLDPSRPSTSVSLADSSSPDIDSDAGESPGRPHGTSTARSDAAYLAQHPSNDIPQDLRLDVDRIFFQFLNMVCSDLDATDGKGEPIHQPLMAKKMQRLDESPDFRPFKFRIQAFTNGFLEELAKQGLPEEIIPMKKVRHYLWTNSYISRFNEDGKKAKSKGNHIWNIDAKKAGPEGGGWHFRPFRRKIAGSFPSVAYVGLRWQFQPRVWDPQASRSNLHVRFSSPSLPPWLSWNGDVLAGTPGADTPNTEIIIDARFSQDGKDVVLSQKYFLNVAPLSRDEPASVYARRPSLGSDRRGLSDSAVAQAVTRRPAPAPQAPASAAAAPYHEALTVVTEAIKAVSIEAHSVQAAPNPDPEQQIQLQTSLTRQEQVLTVTAHALNDAMMMAPNTSTTAEPLARAGTDVVLSALHKVAAESRAHPQEVTMQDVSSATKSAVALAVEQTNTLTSPIDVMLTAETIIQRNTQQQPLSGEPAAPFGPIAPGSGGGGGDGVHPPPVPSGTFATDVPLITDYTMADAIPP